MASPVSDASRLASPPSLPLSHRSTVCDATSSRRRRVTSDIVILPTAASSSLPVTGKSRLRYVAGLSAA
ncbi:hypothetical protein AAHA92_22119 [Salvia divinorum]|uniref:Uncharacterized protein n=1 Tax=Salvia divinorum TaxID=28513 RepID=A0ABD1GMM6_SALDI